MSRLDLGCSLTAGSGLCVVVVVVLILGGTVLKLSRSKWVQSPVSAHRLAKSAGVRGRRVVEAEVVVVVVVVEVVEAVGSVT